MSQLNDSINYIKGLFLKPKTASTFFDSIVKMDSITDERLEVLAEETQRDEKFHDTLDNWFAHEGDKTYRLNYYLDENSVVFDVGGYFGEWSASIFCRYRSKMYVFEPVKKYYDMICQKFKGNTDVKVFHMGLGDKNEFVDLNLLDDGSSEYRNSADQEKVLIQNISDFIDDNKIEKIDLIKINIEGGEYALLNALFNSGKIEMVKNIQVQFHNFFHDADAQRESIREQLRKTHEETYCFEFVWENWLLKNKSE